MRETDKVNEMTNSCQAIAQQFETCFDDIYQTRMHDVPIVNRKLSVKAIGFQEWNGQILGILLTPWFLNLILVPHLSEQEDTSPQVGAKKMVPFASGSFEFIYNYEASVGGFWSCSLLSPVLDLDSQLLAEETANVSLNLILSEQSLNAQGDMQTSEIVEKWNEPKGDEDKAFHFGETESLDSSEPQIERTQTREEDNMSADAKLAQSPTESNKANEKELAQPSKRALFRQLTQGKEQ